MTTMVSEVYDALKDAQGVSDEKARKAAEAVAQFDNRFDKVESEISLLKWMVGFNLVLTLGVLWRLLSH